MQIKVEISEELAGRAKDQGVPVESYVQSLLQERVAGESQPPSPSGDPRKWQRSQVDRLLDLNHQSRLDQIEAALGF